MKLSKLKEAAKSEKFLLLGTALLVAAWAVSTFCKDKVDSNLETFHFYRNAAAINYNALATNENTLFSVLRANNATQYDSIKAYANSLMNSSNILTLTAKALGDTTGKYLPKDKKGIVMEDIQGKVYWLVQTKNLKEIQELYDYLSRIQTPLYVNAEQDASLYLKDLQNENSRYNTITLILIILGTISIYYDKFIKYMKKN